MVIIKYLIFNYIFEGFIPLLFVGIKIYNLQNFCFQALEMVYYCLRSRPVTPNVVCPLVR